MALATARVWVRLDDPGFVRSYLDVLACGGLLALLALGGVALWAVANRS